LLKLGIIVIETRLIDDFKYQFLTKGNIITDLFRSSTMIPLSIHPQKPVNALILQGDWEGGLSNVAIDLIENDVNVVKVVLNAADWIYKKRGISTVNFDRPFEEFETWLRSYITENSVDCLILYNQYRPYNQVGWDLAEELNIECLVLELGLLRPDFCTIYTRELDHFSFLSEQWKLLKDGRLCIGEPEEVQHLAKMRTMAKMKQFAVFFIFSRIMAIFFSFWFALSGEGKAGSI